MSDISKSLPPFLVNMKGISELLSAADIAADKLEDDTYDAFLQLAASTADSGLNRWEEELGLANREDLDDESRRGLVLAALDMFGPCTPERIKKIYSNMTGGEATYSEIPSQYKITLGSQADGRIVADLPTVAAAVRLCAPAHINCDVSFSGSLEAQENALHCIHGSVLLHIY